MRKILAAVFLAMLATASAQAHDAIAPPLADISFLVGSWGGGSGKVAETGGRSKGSSRITVEANGAALLRRDQTQLYDAAGKKGAHFEQIMLIYPESGTLHADYSDGTHVIHYITATIKPGASVEFFSAKEPAAPQFRLSYALTPPKTLTITFAMALPGQSVFQEIASGTLTKTR